MDFTGKVVLITGASSGIGAVTAKQFAKRGARLSLAGRNEDALQQVAKECHQLSEWELPFQVVGDLADEQYVRGLMKKTLDKFGRLDVLVNNAGTLELGSVEDPEVLKQYDRIFSVNVRPVLLLTTLAVPHLTQTKGNIINVSSIAGYRSLPGILAYSMSKSAVDQLTHCTALELAPKQIRVNCVNPGTIVSQIQARAGVDTKTYYDKAKHNHPLGRVGQPEEVAAVIIFLASEMASFVTGVTIPVDGGRHCMTPTTMKSVDKIIPQKEKPVLETNTGELKIEEIKAEGEKDELKSEKSKEKLKKDEKVKDLTEKEESKKDLKEKEGPTKDAKGKVEPTKVEKGKVESTKVEKGNEEPTKVEKGNEEIKKGVKGNEEIKKDVKGNEEVKKDVKGKQEPTKEGIKKEEKVKEETVKGTK